MEAQNNPQEGMGLPKLSLDKETISKLSDEQLKNVIGGLVALDVSCDASSCSSQKGASSCGSDSCNC